MLIVDPKSTCKWHCKKKSNSHSGCKNEQQLKGQISVQISISSITHVAKLKD